MALLRETWLCFPNAKKVLKAALHWSCQIVEMYAFFAGDLENDKNLLKPKAYYCK